MTDDLTEFYQDKEIFITGGTGFIGETVIEKLLRSMEVKCIYMLLREKRGKSMKDRLDTFKNHYVFDRLKKEKPESLDKIFGVSGDISQLNLGLSPESVLELKNVSVIFHSAATISFNEPLKKAVCLNVRAARELLDLAVKLPNLKSLVHISTLYCHPYLDELDEKIYPAPLDWRKCIKMVETMPESIIDSVTQKIIEGYPNTYTFTKHLCEEVMNDYRHKVPIAIIRPSIVINAVDEPYSSFLDSKAGPIGLAAVGAPGLYRTVISKPDIFLDMISVDFVSYTSIFLGMKKGKEKLPKTNQIFICNCSGTEYEKNPFSELVRVINSSFAVYPSEKMLWKPHIKTTQCAPYFMIRTFFYQLLPAVIIDGILRLCGKQAGLLRLQRFIYANGKTFLFFTTNSFKIKSDNLVSVVNEAQSTLTSINYTNIIAKKVEEYGDIVAIGIRRHLLKFDDSTLLASRKLYKKLDTLDLFVRLGLCYIMAKYAWSFLSGYLFEFVNEHFIEF